MNYLFGLRKRFLASALFDIFGGFPYFSSFGLLRRLSGHCLLFLETAFLFDLQKYANEFMTLFFFLCDYEA